LLRFQAVTVMTPLLSTGRDLQVRMLLNPVMCLWRSMSTGSYLWLVSTRSMSKRLATCYSMLTKLCSSRCSVQEPAFDAAVLSNPGPALSLHTAQRLWRAGRASLQRYPNEANVRLEDAVLPTTAC